MEPSIIEAISTDTTAKTANNKQDEVTAYKSSILQEKKWEKS